MHYRYDYGYGSELGAGSILLLIVVAVLAILVFVAWCKLFIKAGLPWERMFVPIYGNYWQYKVADSAGLFWAAIGIGFLSGILSAIAGSGGIVISAISGLAALAIHIVYMLNLAKAYGKSGGFAVGLILLYPIFIMILGFGSAEYVGGSGGYVPSVQAASSWTCPSCGTINSVSRGSCEKCSYRR